MVAMSGRGKFGRYLKRATTFPGYLHALTSADAQQVIEDLLRVLAGDGAGLLSRTQEPRRKGSQGYRVRETAMVWRPGDGTHAAYDPLARTFSRCRRAPRVNPYFVRLYRNVARRWQGWRHASTPPRSPPEVREEREEEFRKGELKLLYCSPTMELGVDIAGLNAVSHAQRAAHPGELRAALRPGGPVRASPPWSPRTAPPATATTSTTSAGPTRWSPGSLRRRAWTC